MATPKREQRTLRAMRPGVWYAAYELGANQRTLDALVRKGQLITVRLKGQPRYRHNGLQLEFFSEDPSTSITAKEDDS